MVQINSVGVKEWDRTFGGEQSDFLYSLLLSSDGTYILGGASDSGISGNKTSLSKGGFDYWIVQLTVTEGEGPACAATGTILRERWDDVEGHSV